jgi:hypothetical protein
MEEQKQENFSILFWHIKDSMVHARAAGKEGGDEEKKKKASKESENSFSLLNKHLRECLVVEFF